MTDPADRWAEVEKAVELAKDSTRFIVTPEYPCLLELRARVQELEDDSWKQAESASFCVDALVKRIEALEAKFKSTPNLTQIGSPLSPAEAGFDGAAGIGLNRADMPDGGVFRLRRGPTDPRHDRTSHRNQLIWYMPPNEPAKLLWCNSDGDWFTCVFEREDPSQ